MQWKNSINFGIKSFVENVQMILEKGVYPSATNYKGETPLPLSNCLFSLGLSNMTGSASSLFNTHPNIPVGLCGLDAGHYFR